MKNQKMFRLSTLSFDMFYTNMFNGKNSIRNCQISEESVKADNEDFSLRVLLNISGFNYVSAGLSVSLLINISRQRPV